LPGDPPLPAPGDMYAAGAPVFISPLNVHVPPPTTPPDVAGTTPLAVPLAGHLLVEPPQAPSPMGLDASFSDDGKLDPGGN
jgi:hypothetical protein